MGPPESMLSDSWCHAGSWGRVRVLGKACFAVPGCWCERVSPPGIAAGRACDFCRSMVNVKKLNRNK